MVEKAHRISSNRSRGVLAAASLASSRGSKRQRYIVEGMCYHTISVTRGRRPIFSSTCNAEILVDTINFIRTSGRAYVLAFAVLPDHLHLLLVPRGSFTVVDVMKSIKNYTASMINKQVGSCGPVWQDSFYDRVIRSDRHLRRTVEYIHMNPVEAGIVQEAALYAFSTANPLMKCDIETFLGE